VSTADPRSKCKLPPQHCYELQTDVCRVDGLQPGWFKHDLYAFTLGGGAMDNPGRYLVLLPPINGAVAYTRSIQGVGHVRDV
jgi:hypothetical protein